MATRTSLALELPALHTAQRRVVTSKARFIVCNWGRRCGKSLAVLLVALTVCCEKAGARVWFVAPTFPMADLHWDTLCEMTPDELGVKWNQAKLRATFPNGSYIQFKSAEHPNRLRGPGLDLLIIDEASFVPKLEEAFEKVLRASLSDRKGRCIITSTPNGLDYFHAMYQRGQDPAYPDWESFTAPTISNPWIEPGEIDDARRDLPERTFRQEYEAEFIVDGGVVFRGVDACVAEDAPHTGPYVMGVDWGKREDFTVFTIIDKPTGRVVAVDRMNQIDYTLQTQRLAALNERWQVEVILAEKNSIGDPLIETLQAMNLPVMPFDTTNASKTRIIEALSLATERREVSLPPNNTLLTELKVYTVNRQPGGTFRYSAPPGLHDDCVMSLALAWEARTMASGFIGWL